MTERKKLARWQSLLSLLLHWCWQILICSSYPPCYSYSFSTGTSCSFVTTRTHCDRLKTNWTQSLLRNVTSIKVTIKNVPKSKQQWNAKIWIHIFSKMCTQSRTNCVPLSKQKHQRHLPKNNNLQQHSQPHACTKFHQVPTHVQAYTFSSRGLYFLWLKLSSSIWCGSFCCNPVTCCFVIVAHSKVIAKKWQSVRLANV